MGMFDGIGEVLGDIAAVAAAPETGGASLMALAPSVIGAAGSYMGQQSANSANAALMAQGNAFNAAQTDKQMQFQKEMRATQYQTAVDDLQKAGLNPMLAYTQGGAGTPAGASAASVSPPKIENKISPAVQSAAQAAQTMNTIQQNNLLKAQANQADSQADLNNATRMNVLDENPYVKDKYKWQMADMAAKLATARYTNATAAMAEKGKALTSDTPYYQDIKRFGSTAYEAWGKLVDKSKQLTPNWSK